MMKLIGIYVLIIILGICSADDEVVTNTKSNGDWLGTPIYSYGTNPFPYYYPYYYPLLDNSPFFYSPSPRYTSPTWNYVSPYYYDEPYWTYPYDSYFARKYLADPWWIGTHKDLPKVMNIARSSSSVRIYSNGVWHTA
jgi:hypothetical protein